MAAKVYLVTHFSIFLFVREKDIAICDRLTSGRSPLALPLPDLFLLLLREGSAEKQSETFSSVTLEDTDSVDILRARSR